MVMKLLCNAGPHIISTSPFLDGPGPLGSDLLEKHPAQAWGKLSNVAYEEKKA